MHGLHVLGDIAETPVGELACLLAETTVGFLAVLTKQLLANWQYGQNDTVSAQPE